MLDHHAVALVVRWVHIAAMATAFGGAALVLALAWGSAAEGTAHVVAVARHYERLFWGAAGVLVMTGVGNLGALGRGLPPPDSDYGATLTLKLAGVAILVVLSAPRSLAIARAEAAGLTRLRLRVLYATTAAGIAAIAGIAVVLSHG